MKELTATEKGYVSGIIDGEGMITISWRKEQLSGFYPMVQVCNTDLRMIAYLMEVTGLGKIAPFSTHGNRKPAYKWTIFPKQDVYDFLAVIYPYLICKKERADILYKLREVKERQRLNGAGQGGLKMTPEVIAECNVLRAKMSELNFRGLKANGENSVDTQNGQYRAEPIDIGRCDGQA